MFFSQFQFFQVQLAMRILFTTSGPARFRTSAFENVSILNKGIETVDLISSFADLPFHFDLDIILSFSLLACFLLFAG